MSFLDLGDNDSLFYLHTPPSTDKPTVVFVNALIEQTAKWEGHIC